MDVEITPDEAVLILNDFNTALEDLNHLLLVEAHAFTQPPDAFGSGVDGQAERETVRKSGETFKKYVLDMIKAVTEARDRAKARFEALFGADFDSRIDISKLDPQIQDGSAGPK